MAGRAAGIDAYRLIVLLNGRGGIAQHLLFRGFEKQEAKVELFALGEALSAPAFGRTTGHLLRFAGTEKEDAHADKSKRVTDKGAG